MPMTLQVGLTKKLGLPDYGSLGAMCHVEIELDSQSLQGDAAGFRRHVQQAFAACEQAVEAQLARAAPHRAPLDRPVAMPTSPSNARPATASQARALRALADRQRLDLPALLGQRFGVDRPEDLSLAAASNLIESLMKTRPRNGGQHAARH